MGRGANGEPDAFQRAALTATIEETPRVADPTSHGAEPGTVTIYLERKKATVSLVPGETLLESARRAGLDPPFNCEAGNCGTCMARLESGHATMRINDALDDDEVDEGYILRRRRGRRGLHFDLPGRARFGFDHGALRIVTKEVASMAKGIMLVESRPSSPEREQEYNTWYDEVHLPELLALDGIVSARRLRPVNGEGPYVAIYEIEGDDLQAVLDNMIANAGNLTMSDALLLDPAPVPRLLATTIECGG